MRLTFIICRAFLTKLDVRLLLLQSNNREQLCNTSAEHCQFNYEHLILKQPILFTYTFIQELYRFLTDIKKTNNHS